MTAERASDVSRPSAGSAIAVAVAAGAAVVAAIGVFARGDASSTLVRSVRGESYEMATTGVYANNAVQLVAEGIGWDAFSLFLVAPALLVAALAAARGSTRGAVVTAGLLGYFLYLHLEYSVTWAFGPMFAASVALTGASLVGLMLIGLHVARLDIARRIGPRFPRRSWAALSGGMAILITIMWTGRVVGGLQAGNAVQLHGEVTMTVQALDLGLVVPLSLVLALGCLRRSHAAMAASAVYVVTFVAMSGALVAMLAASWIVTGAPAIEPIAIFGTAAILGTIVAIRMHEDLEDSGGRHQRAPRQSSAAEPATG